MAGEVGRYLHQMSGGLQKKKQHIDEADALNREPWVNPENNNVRRPLFTRAVPREKRLSNIPMTSFDIFRMMKRHVRKAGLPTTLIPHSYRSSGITDLLSQGVELADIQKLVHHSDPRTTKLYDHSERKITRNLVERIRIGR